MGSEPDPEADRRDAGMARARQVGQEEVRHSDRRRAAEKPTPDERAGMDWWNALTEAERSLLAAHVADTATPAEAWDAFKQLRQ